jgi:uncharacterized membrane protein
MASQKRGRAAAGQAKSGGTPAGSTSAGGPAARRTAARADTATRPGSANSKRAAGRTTQSRTSAEPVRAGKPGRAGGGQGGRGARGRGEDSRGQGGRQGAGRPGGSQGRSGPATAEPVAAGVATRPSAPRWFQLTTLALSLAGLGVSIYLTIVHYGSTGLLVCTASGAINCEKVVTSPESMVFGVFPVAVLGLAFYVFMVAINTPWAWRSRPPLIWWARLAGIVTGMGFVLYLLYAEIIQIGNICLWCTGVHAITFVLFALLVFYATLGTGATARDAR